MKNVITSTSNPEVKALVALQEPKERRLQKKYIAEGLRTCKTIAQHHTVLHWYVAGDMLEHVQDICPDDNMVTLVNTAVMKKISTAHTPSGVLAVFEIPELSPVPLQAGLVLAGIADPGNMGTLLRTCAALNKKTVILIEGTDPWSPKVIQASAGTIAQLHIIQLSWQELITRKGALKLYGLVPTGGKAVKTVSSHDALLVVGNEAHGLSGDQQKSCDDVLSLPMPGDIESLNAAVAGSIALYMLWE